VTAPDRTPAPPLDETDLQRIEQRAEAATPGPWFWSSYAGVFSAPLAQANDDGWDSDVCWVANRNLAAGDTPNAQGGADMDFIAEARTDVPALVNSLRAARADRDEFRASFQELFETTRRYRAALGHYADAANWEPAVLRAGWPVLHRRYRSGAHDHGYDEARAALAAPGAGGRGVSDG
jgi:hypothetical protein